MNRIKNQRKSLLCFALAIILILSIFISLPVRKLHAGSGTYVRNLQASVDHATRRVTIRWDKNFNANGYYIFRMFEGDAYMPYIAYTMQNQYSEIPEKAGFVYYLVIPFQIVNGKQVQGTYQTNTYSYTAPPKVENLSVLFADEKFQLLWNQSPGATRYRVAVRGPGQDEPMLLGYPDKTSWLFSEYGELHKGDKYIFTVQPIYAARGVTLEGPVSYTYYIQKEESSPTPYPDVPINEKNFPDASFRSYVHQFDTNHDNVLSSNELNYVEQIDVINRGIQSMQGIENFPELKNLACNLNEISSLDVSKNPKLRSLICHGNQITGLDLSHNSLLEFLGAEDNQISKLDLSQNNYLIGVYLNKNPLNTLNLGVQAYLTELNLADTYLSDLDLSMADALEFLDMNNAYMSSIDLTNQVNLYYLDLNNNMLDDIDVSGNTKLSNLNLFNNSLSSLDISNNPNLSQLDIRQNYISSIDLSNNPLLDSVEIAAQLN